MANFLDDLTSYNAKASAAIAAAVTANQQDKANLMSALKSTANDTTLTDDVRLEALTALINVGRLLDIPLPPYFPVTTTYASTQSYIGVHNDLSGLQGGAPGEYYHLTASEKANILGKAGIGDINWANLGGVYTDNAAFAVVLNGKQDQLNGNGFVKVSGTTISYDNSTYLTTTTLNALPTTGELSGTYGNTTLSNAAVIGKLLTGFSSTTGTITSSDTILSAIQKLNGNLAYAIANPSGVSSVALTNNATSIFTTTSTPQTGVATLSLGLNTQTQNKFLASPSGSSGQPSFRAIVSADLPASGVTAGTYGSTTLVPQIVVDSKGRITSVTNVSAAAGGQVNTITISTPSLLPSSITGTGANPIINIGLDNNITANTVFAGPTYGLPNDTPVFRALETYDIPALPISQITSLQDTLDGLLDGSLANGTIYMGNTSNAAVNAMVTGDLTAAYVFNINTSENEAQFTIANKAVTYAKFQDIPGQRLLGRYDATSGSMQQITLDPLAFTLNTTSGILGLVNPNPPTLTTKGDILTSTGSSNQVRLPIGVNATLFMADSAATTGNKWVAMSGDATIATTGVLTIGNGAVTFAKMANIANNTIIGNNSGITGQPLALTATQVTAILNQFTPTTKGLVPAALGNPGATYFLNAAGGWTIPAGGGSAPGGSASEVQYRAGVSTFGGITQMQYNTSSSTVDVKFDVLRIVDDAISPTAGVTFDLLTTSINDIWTFPAGSDVFVGEALIQTLTNKTLSTNSVIDVGTNAQGTMWYTGSASYLTEITPPTASNKFLSFNIGSGGFPEWVGLPSFGDVYGPSSSTANAIVLFDGLSGKNIKDSAATLPLQLNYGGTGTNLTAVPGAVAYSATTYIGFTAAATAGGQLLQSQSTTTNVPVWTTASYPIGALTNLGILYASSTTQVSQIAAPTDGTYLKYTNSLGYHWASAGSGSGTVSNSATANVLAYYAAAGTTVTGLAAITASKALVSDANGLPVASSVTTTQLQYLSSATGTTGTTSTNLVFSTSPTITTPTVATSLTASYATASTIAIFDASKNLISADTTTYPSLTELSYVKGVTSAIQTQLNGKEPTITTLSVAKGGTGQTSYTDGQLLIGNTTGNTLTKATLTQSSGITITNGGGSISIANAGVTSFSAGTTGFTPSTTTTGAITLAGTLAIANGGTGGTATATNGGVAYGTGSAYAFTAAGTSGQVLQSNGAAAPTWITLSTTATLTNLGAATGNATLSNVASVIIWNWNSNTTTNPFALGSTSLTSGTLFTLSHTTSALTSNLASYTSTGVTTGVLLNLGISGSTATSAKNLVITNSATTNTSGRGIDVLISGATNSSTTYAGYLSNTKTGTASTNYALALNASGGTTNYALDVLAGITRFAAGTGAASQLVLSPSTLGAGSLTSTTNGAIWYDTTSTTSSIYLYKDTSITKMMTMERNADLATGSSSGVLISDTSGNITKSADLTALGIFASTADGATVSGNSNADLLPTTVTGSKTLAANFFAVGKTIQVFVAGRITTAASPGNLTLTLQVGTAGTPITIAALTMTLHNNVTNVYWEARFNVVCLTTGSGTSATTRTTAIALMSNGATSAGNSLMSYLTKTTSSGFDSTTTQLLQLNGASTVAGNSVTIENANAIYLN